MSNSARSLSGWLTEHEAAGVLSVTEADIKDYISQGLLSGWSKGPDEGILIPQYEILALKERLEDLSRESFYASSLPVPTEKREVRRFGNVDAQSTLLDALEELLSRSSTPHKLLLTIEEAHQLSGLPKSYLKDAIKRHKLMAVQVARKWLIKRSELQSFIDSL
jgi:excisionase family DNA binding protein